MTKNYYNLLGRDIHVEDGSFTKAIAPNSLISGGLGPCIAIGFYHSPSKSGYMLHDSNLYAKDLKLALAKLRSDYQNLNELKICVTGNSLDLYEPKLLQNLSKEFRKTTEEILCETFLKKQLKIQWTKPNHIGELVLILQTGKFEINSEAIELNDYFEYMELKKLFGENLN